jgi:hypothetical protein
MKAPAQIPTTTTTESEEVSVPAPVIQKAPGIIFASDGNSFQKDTDAMDEMRTRKLDPETWMVARSPKNDGFCLMTFRFAMERDARRKSEIESARNANKKPMRYFRVKFGVSIDPLKPDQATQPILVNGEVITITLGRQYILPESYIEVLENARTLNIMPATSSESDTNFLKTKDGKAYEIRGHKDRVAWTRLEEVTREDYLKERARNQDVFRDWQIRTGKEAEQASQD